MIRRNFFNDPIIAGKYDIQQRFLLIGLACASDDYGRFWWNGRNLKSIIYPIDNRQAKWIEKNLEFFNNDGIICKYEVKNITYGHFPLWFDKSFILRQRLDHPKPEQLPDCNIHQMNEKNTRTLRETSPPSKVNITELNTTKESVNANTDTLSISESLIEEMKIKYPEKDIAQAKTSFLNYPYNQGKRWTGVEVVERFGKWCAKESVSHQKFVEQFKRDSTGFPMAYCQECGVSSFYEENELRSESRCCTAKLLPAKP